jgi:hypothetical protein
MTATNFNYLYRSIPPVAWSNTVQYNMQLVVTAGGTAEVAVPQVSNLGVTYYLNGSSVPILGTAPASDTAWSDLSGAAGGLPNLTNGYIWVGNAFNIAMAVAPTGAVTITNAGVTSLTNASVTGQAITGYVSGAGAITATDTILTAINKLNGNTAASSTATLATAGAQANAINLAVERWNQDATITGLAGSASIQKTLTFTSVFPTAPLNWVVSVMEPTTNLPLATKVVSCSASAIIVEVTNVSSTTTGTVTINTRVIGH